MASHNDFGRNAEDAAALMLQQAGWTILHRNWRWRRREIDIIARRGNVVAFIEVRARSSSRHGHPLETIGWKKRLWLEQGAQAWIERFGRASDEYRFDAIAREGTGTPKHVEGAWIS